MEKVVIFEHEHQYDFLKLSQEHHYLKPFIQRNGTYDFSYEGQCALTKAILKHQFDIEFIESPGNLCPPIPSKVIYLRIINRVLKESNCSKFESNEVSIKGVDIGTGAYAIYAILGFKLFNWEMYGVEIDSNSIQNSQKMLHINKLEQYVKILESDDYLTKKYTFLMCNPPFFESKEEMIENKLLKNPLGRKDVIGTSNELITKGGEVQFVTNLIKKSNSNIIWYSSLIGKKSSINILISELNKIKCPNFFIKDYQLGNVKRWIIFWSFNYYRPLVYNYYKLIQPTVVEFSINLEKLMPILTKYEFHSIKYDDHEDLIDIVTYGDVWSRSFRRSGKKPDPKEKSRFIITRNEIHWNYGKSPLIFQSFHTLIKKQLSF